MDACPPPQLNDWIAVQQQVPGTYADTQRQEIADELDLLVRRLAATVSTDSEINERDRYVTRVWECLEYHWRAFAKSGPLRFVDVVDRLENGDLHYGSSDANVLADIVLATALEQGEDHAVREFETRYMPVIRAVANRCGGQRAVDTVENFAAELVLPRGERPPRIATFRGRTPLSSWLRSVVVNHVISESRKQKVGTVSVAIDIATHDQPERTAEDADCAELLRPLFTNVATELDPEDRLVLQMLVLDGVAQNQLAQALGVSSGTLTRRRQRAARLMLERIQQLADESQQRVSVSDCLHLTIAGDNQDLRQRLAEILAGSLRSKQTSGKEDQS